MIFYVLKGTGLSRHQVFIQNYLLPLPASSNKHICSHFSNHILYFRIFAPTVNVCLYSLYRTPFRKYPTLPWQWSLITLYQENHSFHPMSPTDHCRLLSLALSLSLSLYIYIYIIQFICILESQVVECSMGSFYTQRF